MLLPHDQIHLLFGRRYNSVRQAIKTYDVRITATLNSKLWIESYLNILREIIGSWLRIRLEPPTTAILASPRRRALQARCKALRLELQAAPHLDKTYLQQN